MRCNINIWKIDKLIQTNLEFGKFLYGWYDTSGRKV